MNKTIYVRDQELWGKAEIAAFERGISVSELITRALRAHLLPATAQDTLDQIRRLLQEGGPR